MIGINKWVTMGGVLVLATGCDGSVVDSTPPARPTIEFTAGTSGFLPTGVLAGGRRNTFSEIMSDVGEPQLYRARIAEGMKIIRLLWIRMFDPPIAVRIVMTGERCVVTTTFHGSRRRYTTEFAVGRCAEVQQRVIAAGMWSRPLDDRPGACNNNKVILELASPSGYRVSYLWNYGLGAAHDLVEVAMLFLDVSGVNPLDIAGTRARGGGR